MIAPPWTEQAPPTREADASTLGRWRPATPAELTASRRQLSAALQQGARTAVADDGAVQLMLLAFEELVSNALRHGSLPVEVAVTRIGCHWLLEVSDAAADRPPTPATDRDPALGGLGLPLVARMCVAHGWAVAGGRKVVWAAMDHAGVAGPEAPPDPAAAGAGSLLARTH